MRKRYTYNVQPQLIAAIRETLVGAGNQG